MIFDNSLAELVSSFMPVKNEETKLDLTKEEDYKKAKDMISEAREMSNGLGSWSKLFLGDTIDNLINDIDSKIDDIHNKTKNETPDEAENVAKYPNRPSENVDEKMYKKISNITDEYIETMVKPYANENKLTDEMIKNAKDGLFEFACWIYTR